MYQSSAVSVSVVKDFATALVLGSDISGGLAIEIELPAMSSVKAATDFTMSSIPS